MCLRLAPAQELLSWAKDLCSPQPRDIGLLRFAKDDNFVRVIRESDLDACMGRCMR